MTNYNTPILLVIFNRPDKVRELVKALAKIQPRNIYITADGPRLHVPTDISRCAEARAVALEIPWKCEVQTKFSDINRGCRYGVTDAIDWFFEQVESGIILEDDCIPNISFFNFCSTLLEKYKNDAQVMRISGNNFQDGTARGEGSYYFSKYTHSWGWATWKRAWNKYKPALERFNEFDKNNQINTLPLSKAAKKFWIKNFRQTIKGDDSWDSLWLYTVWLNGGLSIIPNKNLVSNIGFGEDATHTKNITHSSNLNTEALDNLIYPKEKYSDYEADEYTFKTLFYRSILRRIFTKISAIINKIWR